MFKSKSVTNLFAIFSYLDRSKKIRLIFLLLISAITAIAELLALLSAIPFLSALNNSENLADNNVLLILAKVLSLKSPDDFILISALLFGTATLISAFLKLLTLSSSIRLAAIIGSEISVEAFKRVLSQPYLQHLKTNSSSTITVIMGQIASTVTSMRSLLQLFCTALSCILLLIGLFYVNILVTLLSLFSITICYAIIAIYSANTVKTNGKKIAFYKQIRLKSLQEAIGSIKSVILESKQGFYLSQYKTSDLSQRVRMSDNLFVSQFPKILIEALVLVTIALVTGLSVSRGQLSDSFLPTLGVFVLGFQKLLPFMQKIYNSWTLLNASQHDVICVLQMLESSAVFPTFRHEILHLDFNNIVLKNVSFSYSSSEKNILNNINLTITRGECIGIVGKTGSGKSTLIDLIMGLLEPSSGNIYVNEQDIFCDEHALILHQWRNLVAHVPQSIYLSDQSVAANIAFGLNENEVNLNQARLAAKLSCIDQYINSLPNKFNTLVGERGVNLSGGQLQRIGIARAMYKNKNVLILDEATSALDVNTEANVIKSLLSFNSNPTIIMIAHRLGTLKNCSRVITLDSGTIVDDSSS